MKLYEYEAKQVFKRYGIAVPEGRIAESPEEARAAALEIGLPVALKSQVLVAGRGKAGGILFADTAEDAYEIGTQLLGSTIKGLRVEKVLVEEKLRVERELYLAIVVDRAERCATILYSPVGGIDIEELARKMPGKISKVKVNPLVGLQPYHLRQLTARSELEGENRKMLADIVSRMYRIFVDYDCMLVESNPLALTDKGLVALDSRMIVDDNALYRHPEFTGRVVQGGFSYVELEGDIAVIGNGAGLTMATMDLIAHYGGRPACFLDIGGGAKAETVRDALRLASSRPGVKTVFMNILGGITRCDEVAKGIVSALDAVRGKPMVVRLAGTNEEEGLEILREAGISAYREMDPAAQEAVKLAGR